MARQGTYYLGRVLKLGDLNQSSLVWALTNSAQVQSHGGIWTFVDVADHSPNYIFGYLARYLPEGKIEVVDPDTQSREQQVEPNLLTASTPFIYLPEFSGIAFLSSSATIDVPQFTRRFSQVVGASLDNFFVRCDIALISDLRAFAIRLKTLDRIFKIRARVSPPNPLFGPLWEHLKDYLVARNADQLQVTEDAPTGQPLKTILHELADQITEYDEYPRYFAEASIPIGDAAILMAADGYGHGSVRGSKDGRVTIIRTTETIANFQFDRDPSHDLLYEEARSILSRINEDRYLDHGS